MISSLRIPPDQVLDIIVKHAGLGMEINNGVIRVAKIEKLQKEEATGKNWKSPGLSWST